MPAVPARASVRGSSWSFALRKRGAGTSQTIAPAPSVTRSLQAEADPRRGEPVARRVAGLECTDVVGRVEERIDALAVHRQRVHLRLGRHAGRAPLRDELV